MRRIPDTLREEMAADPYYSRCCITGAHSTPSDPIEWHHTLIYAGKQISEKWAIVPVLRSLHEQVPGNRVVREKCIRIALNRATDDELRPYSKAINYIDERAYLNEKYGNA